MSDSENTFNEDIDGASTISSNNSDDDSSDLSFKPAIKIGKPTNLKLDNINNDLDSNISDSENENEMPVAGETDDEISDDDDDDVFDDGIDVPVYQDRPVFGDTPPSDDDDDNIDYERRTAPDSSPDENIKIDDSSPDENIKIADDDDDVDSDDSDDEDEDYLKKFDREIINNYVENFHPESVSHNFDEVKTLSNVVRNSEGIIVDKLHKTIPILTKFEKARILGIRAKQLNDGAKPFVKLPPNVIDGYTIAKMELTQKLIPFIIRRPIPNGGCEYWKLADLELI